MQQRNVRSSHRLDKIIEDGIQSQEEVDPVEGDYKMVNNRYQGREAEQQLCSESSALSGLFYCRLEIRGLENVLQSSENFYSKMFRMNSQVKPV